MESDFFIIDLSIYPIMISPFKYEPRKKTWSHHYGTCGLLNYRIWGVYYTCTLLASLSRKYYFSKVFFPDVGFIMEEYPLALVVSHSDSYRRWPNPKFSNVVSIQELFTELETHLQKSFHIHYKTATEFHAFFRDKIPTFILSKYKEMIPTDGNVTNLPSIGDFLGRSPRMKISASW